MSGEVVNAQFPRLDRLSRRLLGVWGGLLVAIFALRCLFIFAAGPYARHVDENFLSRAAGEIVQSGSLEPRFYRYPSLPIYLAALGFAVGSVVDEASPLPPVRARYFPTYSRPARGYSARLLFCLLGVVASGLVALVVARTVSDVRVLFLGPLVALMSPLIAFHTWAYLNVDIVGLFFAAASLAVFFARTDTFNLRRTLAAGLLGGLAIGCKYPLGLVLTPIALAIVLDRSRAPKIRMGRLALLSLGMLAGFLIAVPYFIPHFQVYSDAIKAELEHYGTGHRGFSSEPGLSHLGHQLRGLATQFSVPGIALSLLGTSRILRTDRRLAMCVLSFPVLLLLYISLQRVNFYRNVLPTHVFVACLVAVGLVALADHITSFVESRWSACAQFSVNKTTRSVVLLLLVALVYVFCLPSGRVAAQLVPPRESRVEVVTWIKEHVPRQSTIIIPRELYLADTALRADYRLHLVGFFSPSEAKRAFAGSHGGYALVPRFGFDPRWPEKGARAAVLEKEYKNVGAPVQGFGRNSVLVNYKPPVHKGNPAFQVVRIAPQQSSPSH